MSDNMQGKRKPTGADETYSITFVSAKAQTRSLDEKPTTENTKTEVGKAGKIEVVLSTELGNNVMSIKAKDNDRSSREGEAR